MKPISSCEVSMKVIGSSNREHRKFVFHLDLLTSLRFKPERVVRLNVTSLIAHGNVSVNFLLPEEGGIKLQVVILARNLPGNSPTRRFGHLAPSRQASVGALKSLNSKRGSFFNNN